MAHSTGVDQLAVVLAAAPREVLSLDLVAAPGTVVAALAGPALDTAAKQSYRRRVAELRAEVDEADAHHDLERAARARLELEALMRELRRAVGLGGRDRPSGSSAERARVNVARSLRRAISTVRAQPCPSWVPTSRSPSAPVGPAATPPTRRRGWSGRCGGAERPRHNGTSAWNIVPCLTERPDGTP